jgi:FKBP-type peptidyl-prolyl cis-trans isomerase (trigger factor)
MEDVNILLAELAEEHNQSVIDADYESYMENMMAQYNMMMYAANSYDLDAISYGE